jgi:CheY-like chemotaxis protein
MESQISNKKILIIDDQPEIIDVIKDLVELDFEDNDVHVDISDNPIEGLSLIEKNQYCVICTDLHMPKLSGLELIKKVRSEQSGNQETPFIVITGDNNDLTMSLDDLGDVQVVNKAENIPLLLSILAKHLA